MLHHDAFVGAQQDRSLDALAISVQMRRDQQLAALVTIPSPRLAGRIQPDAYSDVAQETLVEKDIVSRAKGAIAAVDKAGLVPPQRDQAAVQLEQGSLVRRLLFDAARPIIVHRQPRLAARKSAVCTVVPAH